MRTCPQLSDPFPLRSARKGVKKLIVQDMSANGGGGCLLKNTEMVTDMRVDLPPPISFTPSLFRLRLLTIGQVLQNILFPAN